jgi:hypothetical protein
MRWRGQKVVIHMKQMSVRRFLPFMKNLGLWFLKKIRMNPILILSPQQNPTPSPVPVWFLKKKIQVLVPIPVWQIRPSYGSG